MLLAAAGGEVVAGGRSRWVTGLIYGVFLLALLFVALIAGLATDLIPFPLGNEGTTRTHVAVLADLDGDGDLDALVESSRWRGSIRVWLNDGAGNFTPGRSVFYPSDCAAVPGDVDGDGDIDIAAA